jgi:Uncharacterized protein conserved in bacteria (DUF2332)
LSALPLPDQFRLFAQGTAGDKATTYDAICRGIADDPEILALIGEAPPAQRRPNLLLAAVHFLLLGGTRHRLAAHYDTVRSLVTTTTATTSRPTTSPWPTWRTTSRTSVWSIAPNSSA